MSTNFFATEETVTVRLDDDGHYVEIKRELDYGESGDLEGAAIRAGLGADGTPKLEFSLRNQRLLLLALYIVEWNLPGQNGKRVPLPDNIDQRVTLLARLSNKTAGLIVAKIDELRAENGDAAAIKLPEDAEPDPTNGGGDSARGTRSPSPNGSAAPIETSSLRQIGQ